MNLVDTVRAQLGDAELQQIGQQIGATPAQTKQALDAALPMMVGGMAGTATDQQGAGNIQSLFGSQGGMLGNLGGLIASMGGSGAGGILGQILGKHQPDVEQGTTQASGLDSSQVKKLLMILGPIVLAALARHHATASAAAPQPQAGGDGGSLNDTLQTEARAEQQRAQSPHIGGLLGKILDQVQTPRR